MRPSVVITLSLAWILPAFALERTGAGPAGDVARLELSDLDGRPRSLEEHRGRIVVVNFWATWCLPCREEMPILASLQERYADRGVQVIGVSTDAPADRDKVARPALILGTSSDRIGTPSGQSFYATLSKSLKPETGLPIAPYAGVAYGTFEDRWRLIGGLSVGFSERWSALVVHDGVNYHPMINFSHRQHAVSLLLVDRRDPGVAYSVSF